ncbi:MAG: hypothetical protein AVDCRST_MAG79-475, partial [uncultured Thermoleophilia bacterium]
RPSPPRRRRPRRRPRRPSRPTPSSSWPSAACRASCVAPAP